MDNDNFGTCVTLAFWPWVSSALWLGAPLAALHWLDRLLFEGGPMDLWFGATFRVFLSHNWLFPFWGYLWS